MLFCGIDLHSNNSFVVISDDADRVVYAKRLANSLADICTALSPYRQELFGVVVESTFNWYWLIEGNRDCFVRTIDPERLMGDKTVPSHS